MDTEGRDSSNSSRKSSEAREIGSLWGAKVVSADLEVESQGQPLVMEKEPTYHRIQVCLENIAALFSMLSTDASCRDVEFKIERRNGIFANARKMCGECLKNNLGLLRINAIS